MNIWPTNPHHRGWLSGERTRLIEFGLGQVPDTAGARWLDEHGRVDRSRPVPTWLTARAVHVQSLGHLLGIPGSRPVAERGMRALTGDLRDAEHGGWYASVGVNGAPDGTKSAYAHAFVVLAAATATVAQLDGAEELLDEALSVLDQSFWDPAAGMHVDEWDRAFTELSPYRGINANMHAVEALLAAADALEQPRWADRAAVVAGRTAAWAEENGWRVPEHFDAGWAPHLELNADRPEDPFKPYGATVGHGLEWSRLLLQVSAATAPDDAPTAELVEASRQLYRRAVEDGWHAGGAEGFVYTTDWTGTPVVRRRMHWVAAEALAAAAALHRATGDDTYAVDYSRWWDYTAEHLIDRVHGSWHHELDEHNRPSGQVWPGKPDLYHAVQATLLPVLPLTPGPAVAVRDGLSVARAQANRYIQP